MENYWKVQVQTIPGLALSLRPVEDSKYTKGLEWYNNGFCPRDHTVPWSLALREGNGCGAPAEKDQASLRSLKPGAERVVLRVVVRGCREVAEMDTWNPGHRLQVCQQSTQANHRMTRSRNASFGQLGLSKATRSGGRAEFGYLGGWYCIVVVIWSSWKRVDSNSGLVGQGPEAIAHFSCPCYRNLANLHSLLFIPAATHRCY